MQWKFDETLLHFLDVWGIFEENAGRQRLAEGLARRYDVMRPIRTRTIVLMAAVFAILCGCQSNDGFRATYDPRPCAFPLVVGSAAATHGLEKPAAEEMPAERIPEPLRREAAVLMRFTQLQLTLTGFTDSLGTPDYNRHLARERARTVRNYLVKKGIAASRIRIQRLDQTVPSDFAIRLGSDSSGAAK